MLKLTKINIVHLFIVILCTSGCGKDRDSGVSPLPKGAITGVVSPANGAKSVLATPTFSAPAILMLIDSSGSFKATNVTSGQYVININPENGFEQPASFRKTVKAGATLDLGVIKLSGTPVSGNVTFTLDGTNYNINPPYATAEYNSPNFILRSQTAPSNVDHIAVTVTLNNVSGAGTFQIDSSSISTVRIVQYVGPNIYTWSTVKGGNSTVIISSLNTGTRRCSGTFTVNAVAENNSTTGTKAIANGTFTNLSY